MEKRVLVKQLHKSSLKAASEYLIDKEHQTHQETIIKTELNWKSPLLNFVSWADLDEIEEAQKIGRSKSQATRHGSELIFSCNNSNSKLYEIQEGLTLFNLNEIEKEKDQILESFFELSGIDREKAIYEIQFHLSKNEDGSPNPHFHLLYYERELNFDLKPKIYKKDIWKDEKGRTAKAGEGKLYAKKGDIQKDKNGNIKYENDGAPRVSAKNREVVRKIFLENIKNKYREILQEKNPEHYFYVGENPDRIQSLEWTKKMKAAHPEKVEAIKEANKQIRALNSELEQIEEPTRRREMRNSIKTKIDLKKDQMNFRPINLQIEIINQISNLAAEFTRRVKDFLQKAKEKIFWFTQFNIDEEPVDLYKFTQKQDEFELKRFNIENGFISSIEDLGKFKLTNQPKIEISEKTEIPIDRFDETKPSDLTREADLFENQQKMTTERHLENEKDAPKLRMGGRF